MELKALLNFFGCYTDVVIAKLISNIFHVSLLKAPFVFLAKSDKVPKKIRDYINWGIRRSATLSPNSSLKKHLKTRKVLIIYYSKTGNTQKVAFAIERGLKKVGLKPTIKNISEADSENYYDYDIIFFGTPVIHALPPSSVKKFMNSKFIQYRKQPSDVRVPALRIPGKFAFVFVTFSGPHVGVTEALPAGKLIAQEFEHLGFEVKGEWYVVGEFHGWKIGSTRGKMGDIRGRPNADDLAKIETRTIEFVSSLLSE